MVELTQSLICFGEQSTMYWGGGNPHTFSVHWVGLFVDVPGLNRASRVPVQVGIQYFSFFPVEPMLLFPCMLHLIESQHVPKEPSPMNKERGHVHPIFLYSAHKSKSVIVLTHHHEYFTYACTGYVCANTLTTSIFVLTQSKKYFVIVTNLSLWQ